MDSSALFATAAMLFALVFYVRYVGMNLSLGSVFLGLLLLLHSAAYFYYIYDWGPESRYLDFFLQAAGGNPVIEPLSVAIGAMFFTVCAGMWLADKVFGSSPARFRRAAARWRGSIVAPTPRETRFLVNTCVLVSVFMLIPFALADNQIGNVIGYLSAGGSESQKIDLRREFGGSSIYLYNLLTSNVVPFLAFCAVAARRLHVRVPFGAVALIVGLMLLSKMATLSKGPLAIFVIQLFVVGLVMKSLQLKPGRILTMAALVVAIFIGMIYAVNVGAEVNNIIFSIVIYRSLMIPNESLIEYFSAIPHALDFSWGSNISWIAALFQSEPRLPTFWLVGEVHRGSLGSTTTAMFIADAWAEFSWGGVIGYSLLAGFFLRMLDIKLLTRGRIDVWRVGALCMGHFGIYVAMNTSFTTALLTGGLLFVLPLGIWMPRWLRRQHRRQASLRAAASPAEPAT